MTDFPDPLNLIISGVGGQGNILASQLLAKLWGKKGYFITRSETFGSSQRGGAVMSQIRISKKNTFGALIPEGKAHLILGLEPMETIRILADYGNPKVATITNLYSIRPVEAIIGQVEYPNVEKLKEIIIELSRVCWFINASNKAMDLGTPVIANVIMLGAMIGTNLVPLNLHEMEDVIKENLPPARVELNINALRAGVELISR